MWHEVLSITTTCQRFHNGHTHRYTSIRHMRVFIKTPRIDPTKAFGRSIWTLECLIFFWLQPCMIVYASCSLPKWHAANNLPLTSKPCDLGLFRLAWLLLTAEAHPDSVVRWRRVMPFFYSVHRTAKSIFVSLLNVAWELSNAYITSALSGGAFFPRHCTLFILSP